MLNRLPSAKASGVFNLSYGMKKIKKWWDLEQAYA